MPATGTAPPNSDVSPYTWALGHGSGSDLSPTPSSSQSSGSQRRARMSNNRVREAFERSVACSPVSLNTSHESIVPNAASGGTPPSRISHSIFVPEKYGSSTSPVRSRKSGSRPASLSSSQRRAVRRSCQTIARCSGSPLSRSQATTVSRWFVIPMPASERPSIPAESSASLATERVTSQISLASCSTQPGRGKCWRNSRYARPTGRPRSSKVMQVVPVVPWSIARIKSSAAYPAGIVPARPRTGPRRKRSLPDVEAHITGTVWKIECKVGQEVEEGDTLVILESMKMEMPVEAEDGGTVAEIVCAEGQSVSEGDTLVVLE